MKNRINLFCLSILSIILFSGCAANVIGLRKSPSFTYSSIQNGRIGVGGVASSIKPLSSSENASYSNALRNQIIEERKELNVVSSGSLIQKLGNKKYSQLMEDYQNMGSVEGNQIKILGNANTGLRYIVFARIEDVSNNTNRSEKYDTDSKGETDKSRRIITKTASTTISTSFQVADIQEENIAWSGTIKQSFKNSKEYSQKEHGSTILGAIVAVTTAVAGTQDEDKMFPYPDPPKESNVVEYTFEGFAENLPKKD